MLSTSEYELWSTNREAPAIDATFFASSTRQSAATYSAVLALALKKAGRLPYKVWRVGSWSEIIADLHSWTETEVK
jgi:hypothetical protein